MHSDVFVLGEIYTTNSDIQIMNCNATKRRLFVSCDAFQFHLLLPNLISSAFVMLLCVCVLMLLATDKMFV